MTKMEMEAEINALRGHVFLESVSLAARHPCWHSWRRGPAQLDPSIFVRVNKLVDLAEVPSGTLMDKRQLPIRAIPWQKSKNRAVYIGEG